MATKIMDQPGDVTQYDPGAQQGRLDQDPMEGGAIKVVAAGMIRADGTIRGGHGIIAVVHSGVGTYDVQVDAPITLLTPANAAITATTDGGGTTIGVINPGVVGHFGIVILDSTGAAADHVFHFAAHMW